jgi:hypothetical protein
VPYRHDAVAQYREGWFKAQVTEQLAVREAELQAHFNNKFLGATAAAAVDPRTRFDLTTFLAIFLALRRKNIGGDGAKPVSDEVRADASARVDLAVDVWGPHSVGGADRIWQAPT